MGAEGSRRTLDIWNVAIHELNREMPYTLPMDRTD